MSPITFVCYKSIRYIEDFLWEFDRGSVGSTKKCSLLNGIRYIECPLLTSLTVEVKHLVAWKVCCQIGICDLSTFVDNLQGNTFNWILIRDIHSCFSDPRKYIYLQVELEVKLWDCCKYVSYKNWLERLRE